MVGKRKKQKLEISHNFTNEIYVINKYMINTLINIKLYNKEKTLKPIFTSTWLSMTTF